MKLPVEVFLKAIAEKKVYYFSSTKISSTEPHHFICIKKTDNDILIMTCCTSQFETVKAFITLRNLPFETLVWITAKDKANPFLTKETYVNCNNTFTYTLDEFKEMYESENITYSGQIADGHFSQILTGLHKSPIVDEETKELIPKPE